MQCRTIIGRRRVGFQLAGPGRAGARTERPSSRDRERRRVSADPLQPSEIVEFTVDGRFVAQFQVDTVPGAAFGQVFGQASGQAFGRGRKGQPQFAAVDDSTNTATIWTLRSDHDNAQ